MIYFLFFLIGLGAVAYVGLPFWKRRPVHEYSSEAPREEANFQTLVQRRDNLLRQLKELEFDRSMGKTEGEEYALLREELSQQAAAVLQQLETVEPAPDFSDSALPEARMSTHVAKSDADLRGQSFNGATDVVKRNIDLEIEAEVLVARVRFKRRASNIGFTTNATATNATATNATVFCTACGHRLNADDRFCARCGQRRATVAPLA